MLKENTRNSMVKLGSRLIAVDAENSRCTVNIKGEKNIVIRYKYLIIATGAIQSIYGRELLPGYREPEYLPHIRYPRCLPDMILSPAGNWLLSAIHSMP